MLRFFAVYGNPIAHSLSPLLHNATYAHLGVSAYYGRILLTDGESLKESFLSHQLSGANITIPFKEYAYDLCDEVCGIAKEIGACNTWVRVDDTIKGYNTDAEGFYECIKDYGVKSALIIGAGGSAKAVALILKAHNIATTLLNRSKTKLEFFTQRGFNCFLSDEFSVEGSYDLVINTTSAGLNDNLLPCSEEILRDIFSQASYAFDLIYGKVTPFLSLAKDYHLTCSDGRDMLIYQAALAFKLFLPSLHLQAQDIASLMRRALL